MTQRPPSAPPKERGILFSAPMVRAILEGRKTVTRRLLKTDTGDVIHYVDGHPWRSNLYGMKRIACPYGEPGDWLWVRETWCQQADLVHGDLLPGKAHYRADGYEVRHVDGPDKSPWRPSIYMPRWASRITLEVVGLRVERLHDISEEDARAEGIEPSNDERWPWRNYDPKDGAPFVHARTSFQSLWTSINGAKSWAENPWVWRVEFRRLTQEGARHVA